MSDKKLFLLDGHALVYRAHFAFISRPLINSKGMNTSAITGFVRSLWDIIKNQKPSHLAVAFDPKGPTFRHEEYVEYKANRDAQPEDISIALPYIKEIVKGFNIPIIMVDGFEADDTIGTIAKQAEKEGFEVYMVTPDKDYAQLVSDKVFMYKPARMGNDVSILGVPEVLEKWGISRVDQVIDVLGLQGDSVDNIPGIPGIGPKTATKLLKEYDSVEGIIKNADALKGKMKEKVKDFAEQGLLSKRLATIKIDVPISFNAKSYVLEPMNKDLLAELFKELEFRTLANQILGPQQQQAVGEQGNLFGASLEKPKPENDNFKPLPDHSIAEFNIDNTEHDYILIDSIEKLTSLIKEFETYEEFAFDTETTGLDANSAEIVGLSLCAKPGKAYYIAIPEDLMLQTLYLDALRPLLESESSRKVGQNIKYDALLLLWHNIKVGGLYFDTMLAHYLLEPELRHNMNYMAESYLKYKPISFEELVGKGVKAIKLRHVAIEKVTDYAAEDADITIQLKEFLSVELKKENFEKLYWNIEEPLAKVLIQMEYNGIKLDSDFLRSYSSEFALELKELEKEIYDLANGRFNIASPKQVGEVLFERLKVPYKWRKTKSGQYSTNEAKLVELSSEHKVINKILRFRQLTKLKSTYIDSLPKMVNSKSGRIHTSFNQALVSTGRLSSNNPNLQNIPIRTPEGAKIREAFIPADEGHVLLAADYSQIELRLIAEISGDKTMLSAFSKGQDIHAATASRVFDVALDKVTRDQRYRAKTVNFSVIYGAGATNLSRQLEIPRTEASELIKSYFKEFNGLKTWMDQIVTSAREKGYVETLMGRKRHLRDINSRNGMIRSGAERNAINSPIQGSAADLIKIAMIDIQKYLNTNHLNTKMVLQVHDELVFDVPKNELKQIQPIIVDKMTNAIPNLKVPIVVTINYGKNWLEAH